MQRLRELLGVAEISRWTHAVNRQIEDLTESRDEARRRLHNLERHVDVWRFMAWLERMRPPSDRLVSVVTATRNRGELLRTAIASVRAQVHTRWELIVVDDGSDDETPEIVRELAEERILYERTEQHGVCAARNCGLSKAHGSVVTYLDDDNVMDPLWLMAVAWAFDERPTTRLLYGARLIDDWQAVHGLDRGGQPMLQFAAFDRVQLERVNLADTNVIAHRRDAPEARFDERLSQFGDWDLMLRLTADTTPYELPAIACAYSTASPDRLSAGDPDGARAERELVLDKLTRSRRAATESREVAVNGPREPRATSS